MARRPRLCRPRCAPLDQQQLAMSQLPAPQGQKTIARGKATRVPERRRRPGPACTIISSAERRVPPAQSHHRGRNSHRATICQSSNKRFGVFPPQGLYFTYPFVRRLVTEPLRQMHNKVPKYSLENLENHWRSTCTEFCRTFPACDAVFREMFKCASPLVAALAGRKTLEPNCAFVLLTKVLNHASATFLLLQRGLLVDAALTCRNALETSLLLELLVKQPAVCREWSEGRRLRPSEVRRSLSSIRSVPLGDLDVEVSSDAYGDSRFAYDWLSRITHANVDSAAHAAENTGPNEFALSIGGAISRPEIIAITKVVGDCCLRALLTCAAAYAPELVHNRAFDELAARLKDVDVERKSGRDIGP